MKNKVVNKFKRAGVWNIVCGVLAALAFIGFYVVLGLDYTETGDVLAAYLFYGTIFVILGIYLWEALIIFPFFMILTGAELISKHKKGAGVRLLIVFNILMKLLSAFLSGMFGLMFLSTMYITAMVYGGFLLLTTILTVVSIVLDIPALFTKQKVVKNK